jgi:hypothetical protein
MCFSPISSPTLCSYLLFISTLIRWRPAWDSTISPEMFRYAYPVMITGVAGMINEMFSRSMLDWWLPENFYPGTTREEAGGIFGACYKFAVFMNLGIQAFRYAAEPFFFTRMLLIRILRPYLPPSIITLSLPAVLFYWVLASTWILLSSFL